MADNGVNVNSERCVNLRWKDLLVYGENPPELGQAQQCEPACWCVKTQFCLGPDGRQVNHSACSPDRSCYKPM